MTGQLVPFEFDSQQPVEIQVVGIHVNMTLDKLSQGFNLSRYVYLGFDYPFQITFKDQKFSVSAVIRNADGEKIATITNNEWAVSSNNVIAYDRNYNAYAFEVMDSDLVPVIQVVFSPQNKMYLGGFFYIPNGTLLLTDDNLITDPSYENISYARTHTIFNYPSDQHLGELVAKSTYQVARTSAQAIISGEIVTFLGILLSASTSSVEYLRRERAYDTSSGWKKRMKRVFQKALSRAYQAENTKRKGKPNKKQFTREVISYTEQFALNEKEDIVKKQGTTKAEEFYNRFKQVKSRVEKGKNEKDIKKIIQKWYDKSVEDINERYGKKA
jgi:hypothetical protein